MISATTHPNHSMSVFGLIFSAWMIAGFYIFIPLRVCWIIYKRHIYNKSHKRKVWLVDIFLIPGAVIEFIILPWLILKKLRSLAQNKNA